MGKKEASLSNGAGVSGYNRIFVDLYFLSRTKFKSKWIKDPNRKLYILNLIEELRKLEIVLPEKPALPLLVIYPNTHTLWYAPTYHKHMCSSLFIEALFIIGRNLKKTDVPKLKNGYRKCHSFTQWNTAQLLKRRTSWILQANG